MYSRNVITFGVALIAISGCTSSKPGASRPAENAVTQARDIQQPIPSQCQVSDLQWKLNVSYTDDAAKYATYAVFSNNAYSDHQLNLAPITSEWREKTDLDVEEKQSGFAMRVFERNIDNHPVEVVIAFRGTDFKSLRDWEMNLGPIKRQFPVARQNFDNVCKRYASTGAKFVVTGHSLGGGLALHISFTRPEVKAITFDTSPISDPFSGEMLVNERVNVYDVREVLNLFALRKIAALTFGRPKAVPFKFYTGSEGFKFLKRHSMKELAMNLLMLGMKATPPPKALEGLVRANCPVR